MLLDGVSSDLTRSQMGSWAELRRYCVQVASSIGLAMCHLLGAGDDPLARQAAVDLGIAMQLTNILRDVGSDLRAGRVYLPLEELAAHDLSPEMVDGSGGACVTAWLGRSVGCLPGDSCASRSRGPAPTTPADWRA